MSERNYGFWSIFVVGDPDRPQDCRPAAIGDRAGWWRQITAAEAAAWVAGDAAPVPIVRLFSPTPPNLMRPSRAL